MSVFSSTYPPLSLKRLPWRRRGLQGPSSAMGGTASWRTYQVKIRIVSL